MGIITINKDLELNTIWTSKQKEVVRNGIRFWINARDDPMLVILTSSE